MPALAARPPLTAVAARAPGAERASLAVTAAAGSATGSIGSPRVAVAAALRALTGRPVRTPLAALITGALFAITAATTGPWTRRPSGPRRTARPGRTSAAGVALAAGRLAARMTAGSRGSRTGTPLTPRGSASCVRAVAAPVVPARVSASVPACVGHSAPPVHNVLGAAAGPFLRGVTARRFGYPAGAEQSPTKQ
ncbi:hypothetical protein GCM10020369_41110 [Cryptosporangium minutisporangium]|uniref:Uncharacterized protein n=1 Tax=Cryptosporangium minutisporangium TaxID=113569 RepID=A0ABP6T024_9ACTN